MAFVRKKRISGNEYHYLVYTDPSGKKTEKYLGKEPPSEEELGKVLASLGLPAEAVAAKPLNVKESKPRIEKQEEAESIREGKHIQTGIGGFDTLFERGIPQGSTLLVAGGTVSGKTVFCLQVLANNAAQGKKCYYLSFEESRERLLGHMKDFGWEPEKLLGSGNLVLERLSPFQMSRTMEAMLAKDKGELLIEVDPVALPAGFRPDIIALDSLTALASVFTGKKDSYRIYVEQLFRFLENLGCTSFLITETEHVPTKYSPTAVEEFLADGVFVLYNLQRGGVRESAIEVLKMRGEPHKKRLVPMQITKKGIVVYPEEEVFGNTTPS